MLLERSYAGATVTASNSDRGPPETCLPAIGRIREVALAAHPVTDTTVFIAASQHDNSTAGYVSSAEFEDRQIPEYESDELVHS